MTGQARLPHRALIASVRDALAAAADPVRAAGQQRYMKSATPFHGLTSPVLRATLRPILSHPEHQILDRVDWPTRSGCWPTPRATSSAR